MVDGLWTIQFEEVPDFLGGAVVVLQGNHLYGGDSQYYYTGLYDLKGDLVTAMVQVKSFVPAAETVFGTRESQFSIQLNGKVHGDEIRAVAVRPDLPDLRLKVTLVRKTGLA
jgi:hypothetical protein